MSLSGLLQPILIPLSWLYAAAARLDAGRRVRHRYRSSLPVISVGNLSVGGSGKTPLVQFLADRLQAQRPVLILSRGYGRQGAEERVWRVGEPPPDPDAIGDEPALLARSLERGAIAVGPDRARLLARLEREEGMIGDSGSGEPDTPESGRGNLFRGAVVILDDGFQHRQLHRDIDIVLVDSVTAHAPHRLIPAGRLREPPSALRRASLVVATSLSARAFAARFVDSGRIHDAGAAARGVRSLRTGALLPYGSKVVLVTGIARAERVSQTLLELGITVEHHVSFPDHHRYTAASLERIERALDEHDPIHLVTTLKDAVKLERIPSLAARLHVVDVALRMKDEERFLRAIDEQLRHAERSR